MESFIKRMNGKYLITLVFALGTLATSCNMPRQQKAGSVPDKRKNNNTRNDAWGFVGNGGGGAMFYPTVSPFNPNFAFVACDMTGSYVTYDGGDHWRMFNLGAPVSFFVFDPSDSNVVYANAAALYKSIDRGNTWRIFYPSERRVSGVIAKGDHAQNIVVTRDSISYKVQALAINPADGKQLCAAIMIDGENGIYTSRDGGVSWQKEASIADPVKNIFTDKIAVNDQIWIVATARGIYAKESGEWRFNPIPSAVGSFTSFSAGYDSTQRKLMLYAVSGKSYFNNKSEVSGIFFSDDNGRSWQNRQEGLTSYCKGCTPEWRALATAPSHPQVVYVSYNNMADGDTISSGVAKSRDYGKTWQLVWKDVFFQNGYRVSNNFSSGWLNERFGPSWGENPFSIGVAPSNPEVVYTTDFGRTVITRDGGSSWQQVYTRRKDKGWTSRGLEVTTGYNIVMDPFDSTHFFICSTDIGLMESNDGGASWRSATDNNGIPRAWINSTYWLAFDPEIKNRAWAVMSGTHDLPRPKMWRRSGVKGYKGGILITENGGKTWKPVSGQIGEGAFTHILVDKKSDRKNRTLYACAFGKGVYKSDDGGNTWQQKNKGLPPKEPFAWRIIQRNSDGALFLVVSRRSETGIGNAGDGAVYVSTDNAEHWTQLNLPVGVNGPTDLAVDGNNPSKLILSAWGRIQDAPFAPDTGGGIFISEDAGTTWKQVMQEDQHIHDITYDNRNNTFYACGFNSSAYRSTDGGMHWKKIKGYNFKWGKRVVPDPRDAAKVFIITFGGGVWYGPATGDSTAAEDIVSNY